MAAGASNWGESLNPRCRGGKRLTLAVMFVGCLVLGDDPNIVLFLPYKTYWAGGFVPVRTFIGIKLLITPKWPEKHLPVIVIKCYQLRLTHILVHNKYICCSTTRSMACTAGIFCSNLLPWGWSSQMEIETFHPFVSWHCIPLQWQTM